jgi:hypothetical protein
LEVAGRLFEQAPATAEASEAGGAAGAIGLSVWWHWRLRLVTGADGEGWLEMSPLRRGAPDTR